MSLSQESYDEHYIRLSQFYSIIGSSIQMRVKKKAMNKVLEEENGCINYQIPANRFFKAVKPDCIGSSVLHFAVQKQELEICKILIEQRADFTIKNRNNEMPLHEAIKFASNTDDECLNLKGKLDNPFADYILTAHVKQSIFSSPCNTFGLSHFHIACMTNHAEAVEYFLKTDLSVNASIALKSPVMPGFSPLHFAARYCALETVKVLLNYGADVHAKDASGKSPMHLVIERNMQIADSINMCYSFSDVFQTESETNKKIIKLLLERHTMFSSSAVDDIGLSWLQVACTLQDISMLECAINQSGLHNNAISSDSPVWPGYTALHFASHFGMDAVKFLISKGADVTAKDAKGITPLDLCLQRYEAKDIHSIIISQKTWKDIQFSDNKTNLADLILAMDSLKNFESFLQKSVRDLNVFIPLNSNLWPGCTPLHLAVIFKERFKNIDELYKNTNYVKGRCIANKETDLYEKRIELCLDLGADVTIKDASGSTPIHYAFYAQKGDIVYLLLTKHEKIINPSDSNGLTHLHIACAVDNRNLVKKFLQAGCEVNSRVNSRYDFTVTLLDDEDMTAEYTFSISPGSTALHIAVSIGDEELSRMLIKHGADLYAQEDLYGLTPIHLTIISSYHLLHVNITEQGTINLLPPANNFKECTSKIGLTHLHVACSMGDIEAVKKLIDLGANVDATIASDDINASSPWYDFRKTYADAKPIGFAWLSPRNTKMIALLMSRGADILYKNPDLSVPFYVTLLDGETFDLSGIFYPILKGDQTLQTRIRNDTGLTMLHFACEKLKVDDVEELLRLGANPNAQAHMDSPIWPGCTPLHLLLNKGHDDFRSCNTIIDLLLERGADITLSNAEQNTPLHEAFMGPFTEDYLRLPMRAHKDFSKNPVNAYGISHFHLACYVGDVKAIKSFLKKDMDYNQPIDYFSEHSGGATPLHMAALEKCEDAVRTLLRAGADVGIGSDDTPLHEAANGIVLKPITKTLLKMLIDAGSDLDAQNWYGQTALEMLLMSKTVEKGAIELFLKPDFVANVFNEITGEGYICIMATNNLDGLESIQQHPFYKGVIDNPERNMVDDMGRTPIHNIVCCRYAGMRHHCPILIDGFAKVGVDIDHRDKKGRTALHLASQFGNGICIDGLLSNGIDINLLDHKGNAAFNNVLQRGRLEQSSHNYILSQIKKHLYKLGHFGLYVNKANQEVGKQMPISTEKKKHFRKVCREELKKLKDTKIEPPGVCLADFLSETGLVTTFHSLPEPYRRDIDTLIRTHSRQFFEDYPNLVGLLLLQYRKALAREAFIQPAHLSLNSLVGFPVPHVCRYIIFGFLANDDLKNLIALI